MRRSYGRISCAIALTLGLFTGACRNTPSGTSLTAQLFDSSNGDDWPAYGRTYGEQHFSPLDQVNADNAGRLGLAWSMDMEFGNAATQPIEVNGVIYFSSGMSIVHAVDAVTGKLLWTYDSQVGSHAGKEMRNSWGIRGIAWWDGKVYTGTVDGRLIAIDAATGKAVWTAQTTTRGDGRYITGAPRVFNGKVIIGQGGADSSFTRGYVTAYDANSGKQLWRFNIVPGNPADGFENDAMRMAAKTWTGEWWKYGGGGHPWNSLTYDREYNMIIIGTGNGHPWNRRLRSPGGGDNLFLASVLALDADTGAYKWHYQINPGESWDYNATMDIELAEMTIDGKPRKVALTAPKNGFFYVIDRSNGKLISAEKFARATWASRIDMKTGRPVETPDARYPDGKTFDLWPSSRGAHNWIPMAYSPQTHLVYIPKIEHGTAIDDRGITPAHWQPYGYNFGLPLKDPLDNTSSLVAWDPVAQKKVWEVPTIGGWNGGTLATAGNLVFQGQLNGRFSAYRADNGKEVWHFDAQAGILTAPISYRVGGKQYVTLVVGMGASASSESSSHGGLAFDGRTERRRVLTFVLDGPAKLPPKAAVAPLVPPADAAYRPNVTLANAGNALFHHDCYTCHGVLAIGAGLAPDLRVSAVTYAPDSFDTVVRKGALKASGMPIFPELTDADMAALRQYLRSRASEMRAERH